MAMQMNDRFVSLTEYSLRIGYQILKGRSQQERKGKGQFLTPPTVARFLAHQLGPIVDGDRILDPAIGSGTLVCAVIDRLISEGRPMEVWVEGYEIDRGLSEAAKEVLERAVGVAASRGIVVHVSVHEGDFVLDSVPGLQLKLPSKGTPYSLGRDKEVTHIIANPPYFKLRKDDPRIRLLARRVEGYTNIYTLFIALSLERLASGGRACFIVPRSFCSGAYFSSFRRRLMKEIVPLRFHLFESRERVFKADSVLQENVIFVFRKRRAGEDQLDESSSLDISVSNDAADLDEPLASRRIALKHFIGDRFGAFFFRLPVSELDESILDTVDRWPGSSARYGLNISTGPVVAFRAKDYLTGVESAERGEAVPLLWMHNVGPFRVRWPASNGNKPQGILLQARDAGLLLPKSNYVLLRRFSAKEDPRRLIAAPFLSEQYDYPWVGFENHLNYIYKRVGGLGAEEVLGLAALLNSALIDRYFRIVSGHTQVNAMELRALPLPPWDVIQQIGNAVRNCLDEPLSVLNAVVFRVLRERGCLDENLPMIEESRVKMGKIQEAQEILRALGLPPAQQNEISALTLLVLAQLSEETPWQAAQMRCLRIHDILGEIKARYGREYAENTRETIRRQVLHQFVQAGIAVPNPDRPDRPTNSPHYCYALTDLALRTIKAYSSERWERAVQSFRENRRALIEVYRRTRQRLKVRLRLGSGETYYLSPGRHNELQVAIVEEFGPRFVPGGVLVYLGDTENKTVILEASIFKKLGVPVPSHEKLPDVVLYDRERDWLFLVEAVTSHGPVSPKRHLELEEALRGCSAGRVYVTAFPDFSTFKRFLSDIAWETEVWIAEAPDHLIHFNGERLLSLHAG